MIFCSRQCWLGGGTLGGKLMGNLSLETRQPAMHLLHSRRAKNELVFEAALRNQKECEYPKQNHPSQFHGGSSKKGSLVDNWILHPDNTSNHTMLIVSKLVAKMGVATVPQPLYKPDVAPAEFFPSQGSKES
ncbi:hypothetical protein TNCT_254421 [Trichonephila clavata]|uniref:Uncharacterized protein n=1 Tax=Trichonephila clavata TaxID=2740835 RepID=A0A8X6FTN1_TRICU|nr:hypothetical protein TNCT_254421 [Trichonephila clavata]